MSLSQIEFDSRVKKISPNITVLDKWQGWYGPKLRCRCKCGKKFEASSKGLIITGVSGCRQCRHFGGARLLTHAQFVAKVKAKHGSRISIVGTYTHSSKPISASCNKGHAFKVTAASLSGGMGGCKQCANKQKRLSTAHCRKLIKQQNPKIKLICEYTGVMNQHTFACLTCKGNWSATMSSILHHHSGCPVCSKHSRVSKIAIKWLEIEARKRRIVIQHGANEGEFKIPGTRLKVDGYNKRSNTVFEFYGDAWHGNPKIHKPRSKPLSHIDRTAKQMYEKTLEREQRIRALGYNLVTMWESDFRNSLL